MFLSLKIQWCGVLIIKQLASFIMKISFPVNLKQQKDNNNNNILL